MCRLIPFTEGQRMALLDILGEYLRLAASHVTTSEPRGPGNSCVVLPTTFWNASDGTECSVEELLVKLLDPPVAGFVGQDVQTGDYQFRDSRGHLWRLVPSGADNHPFEVQLLERRR